MLIASVSDIHLDYKANRALFIKMAAEIGARGADVALVVGDVCHIDELIVRSIRVLAHQVERVAYVPGNHDLWVDRPEEDLQDDAGFNTWKRHDEDLKRMVESAGGHYLPAEPLRVGDVAIAGSCGWYDYSFLRPEFRNQISELALREQTIDGMQWGDRTRTAFRDAEGRLMSNPEVARRMEDALDVQLSSLEHDPAVEQVVCATHHQQYEQTVRRAGTLPWEFFNAFMGSRRMGEVIDKHSKVGHVIYGHTHALGEYRVGTRRVFGTPLAYPRERKGVSEDEILRTRIGWIEL
ncbi:MAG: metallophosphoesterase [Deltaproteobacteria bacterium]|nr:metallophosphoesterase [Deltaproteobacteria bacterium]